MTGRATSVTILALAMAGLPGTALAASSAGVRWEGTPWLWANPSPTGAALQSVDFEGSRGVVSLGADKPLLSANAGASFGELRRAPRLSTAQVVDANTVVGTRDCDTYRSDNGGETFRRLAVAPSRRFCSGVDVFFVNSKVGYVLREGTIFRTENGGRDFFLRAPVRNARQLHFVSDQVGFAITEDLSSGSSGESAIFRTSDGARTWTRVARPDQGVTDIDFASTKVGVAVGGRAVLRTDDGGLTWTRRALEGAPRWRLGSVRCADADVCLITGGPEFDEVAGVLRTDDGGATATRVPGTGGVEAVDYSTRTRAVAVGRRGLVLVSDDGGASFTAASSGVSRISYRRLRPGGSGSVFALSPRRITRSVDEGRSWQPLAVRLPTRDSFGDASFTAGREGAVLVRRLAGTAFDRTDILRTDDGGLSWTALRSRPEAEFGAVITLRGGRVVVAPRFGGGLQLSVEGGRNLRRVSARAVRGRRFTRFDRAGAITVAYGPRALAISSNGRRWRRLGLPPGGIRQVDMISARTGFALSRQRELYRTRDGGRGWQRVLGAGAYLTAAGEPDYQIAFSTARRGFLVVNTNADAMDPETRRWTDKFPPSFLLRTDDGGRSWRPQFRVTDSYVFDVVAPRPGGALLSVAASFSDAPGLLWSPNDGDAPSGDTRLMLKAQPRVVRRGAEVVVGGHLTPARAGDQVLVTRQTAKRQAAKFVRVRRDGSFRSRWLMFEGATFVAQWRGDGGRRGAATAPLQVRVAGRR